MIKKELITLIIFIFLSSTLTGCRSKLEVNDLAIVTGIALDKVKDSDEIIVSYQIYNPSNSQDVESTGSYIVVSDTGNTTIDIKDALQNKLSRIVILSHNHSLLISEDVAKDGIAPWIDYFTRYQDGRLKPYVYITDGMAMDYLDHKPYFENYSGELLDELENFQQGIAMTMLNLIDILSTSGKELAISKIEFLPVESTGGDNDSEEVTIALSGLALFKDDKMIDFATEDESKWLLLLLNPQKISRFSIQLPNYLDYAPVGFEIFNSKTDITPTIIEHQLVMAINLKVQTYLYENTSKLDLTDANNLTIIKDALEEALILNITKTIHSLQDNYKTDILGFGRALEKAYPKDWNAEYKDQWDELFQNVEVAVTVDITIDSVGNINNSLTINEDELLILD
jgi:spore germination protein KC